MVLEPEDAIPPTYLPATDTPVEKKQAGESNSVVFFCVLGIPWLAGAGWLEWNNHHTGWVSLLLLSGFAFVATGFVGRKYTDGLIICLLLLWLGLYVYGLVTAESISLRVWLGVWLLDAFVLFGGALPRAPRELPQAPATGEIHDRRGPEL
ncbi:hypothetical protein [Actinospica sp.]|jgi:hypothetical protein|uniref:hypothetical protein n=1 Tax=Actinospica sp. TaxID=1872142 RepID=UPI002D117598|nr:hypothetical protein [Actinospica sp.]HWG23637.1 hypothetical protein [Actinospica sp.]